MSPRPDPDKLLAQVQAEEHQQMRGKLKIFLGYAAGVGKTYAMLEAAHQRKREGVDVVIGYIETEILDHPERLPRHGGWADVGNLHVAPGYRRRGVGSWLLGQAAGWLRLAGANRLLSYAWLEGTDPGGLNYDDYRAFLPAVGFRELTRTARGWTKE